MKERANKTLGEKISSVLGHRFNVDLSKRNGTATIRCKKCFRDWSISLDMDYAWIVKHRCEKSDLLEIEEIRKRRLEKEKNPAASQ